MYHADSGAMMIVTNKHSLQRKEKYMAPSKCPQCPSSDFEFVLKENIRGTIKKMFFVQCTACGTVVGVTDYFDTAAILERIVEKLNIDLSN